MKEFDLDIINTVFFETYESNLDEFLELVEAFDANIQSFLKLELNAASEDSENLQHLAHKLRSSCASLGFMQLADTLKTLEESLYDKSIAVAEPLYTKARQQMNNAPERLRKFAQAQNSK